MAVLQQCTSREPQVVQVAVAGNGEVLRVGGEGGTLKMGSMWRQTCSKARLKVSRRRASVSRNAEVAATSAVCASRSAPPVSSSFLFIASYCSTACTQSSHFVGSQPA